MFIVQPLLKFGEVICEQLHLVEGGHRKWRSFEFAVAWVNYRGAVRVRDSATDFLAAGGTIRATVGLDFSSTSYEGLFVLMELESSGADITTHVFYDENPVCTFHPKVFLFGNEEESLLIVGSNNMTGAGFKTNIEAALGVTAESSDQTMRAARQTLAAWRDDSTETRSKRLTRELLEQLRERGYVRTEEEIRNARQSRGGGRLPAYEPLFGKSETPSSIDDRGTGGVHSGGEHTSSGTSTEVLLMRVRPRRTGTQLQISMLVHQGAFMNNATEVISDADGTCRPIGYDFTHRDGRSVPNLARFEAPEMARMTNPVARFRWVPGNESENEEPRGLYYDIFDADSDDVGRRIYARLREGILYPPVTNLRKLSQTTTVLSKRDISIAQWYRLDSM